MLETASGVYNTCVHDDSDKAWTSSCCVKAASDGLQSVFYCCFCTKNQIHTVGIMPGREARGREVGSLTQSEISGLPFVVSVPLSYFLSCFSA